MKTPEVKVHRTENGTTVESPCQCFGNPNRVHSTQACPWLAFRKLKAGEVPVGTILGISCCDCLFKVTGRDPDPRYHRHVIFKQTFHCKTIRCDMNKGQELWLFDDHPIAGVPGKHDLIFPPTLDTP